MNMFDPKRTATLITQPDGTVHIDIPVCPACHRGHREPLRHLEQKVTIDGVKYLFQMDCTRSGSIFLLAPSANGTLKAHRIDAPPDQKKP